MPVPVLPFGGSSMPSFDHLMSLHVLDFQLENTPGLESKRPPPALPSPTRLFQVYVKWAGTFVRLPDGAIVYQGGSSRMVTLYR